MAWSGAGAALSPAPAGSTAAPALRRTRRPHIWYTYIRMSVPSWLSASICVLRADRLAPSRGGTYVRELDVARVTEAVAKLAVDACNYLGDDVVAFFEKAAEREESETGRDVLAQLLENAKLARDTNRAALPGHRSGRGVPGDRPGRAPGRRQTSKTPSTRACARATRRAICASRRWPTPSAPAGTPATTRRPCSTPGSSPATRCG